MVIDADGINALCKLPDYRRKLPENLLVFTPHPGELSRLTGVPIEEIMSDPVHHARDAARRLGSVVLLKGACSITASPDGRMTYNATGNAGMATAGSGDTLTGMITALLAQGLNPYDAARLGAYVHGRSGDIAVKQHGMAGMIASDLIAHLGDVWLEMDR